MKWKEHEHLRNYAVHLQAHTDNKNVQPHALRKRLIVEKHKKSMVPTRWLVKCQHNGLVSG